MNAAWGTLGAAVTAASLAHAQGAPTPASTASAPEGSLPSVVVVGEKTVRKLDDTATSVKVFDDRTLGRDPALSSMRTLYADTVNVVASGTQNLAPAVRGIDGTGPSQGSDAFLAGTRSRLSIVVDGRPASFNEISFGDLGLWDVKQVELFRGAQSTLQGRNAIAGTVNYVTNEPTFTPEYGLRVAGARFDSREVAAVAGGPLSESVAYRVAVSSQRSDSFVEGYEPYPGVSDPGRFEGSSVRGKLLFKPKAMPGFSTLLTVAHTRYEAPQTDAVARPFEDFRLTPDPVYTQMPTFEPWVTSAVVDTVWPLNARWTLENRLVFGDFKIRRHATPDNGSATIDGHDATIEPRLRYASEDQRLSGFVGLYGFRAKQRDELDLFGGGSWDDRTTTTAVYGEATYTVAADVDVTAGGRYERERRRREGTLAFFTTDFNETYSNFLPKLSVAWKGLPKTTVGIAVSRGYNGGNAGFTYDEPYVNYTYQQESVWNFELFGRSRLLGDRLALTGNIFHSRYRDMQLPFDLNPDPTVWAYVVRNAPRAETYGAELGLRWLPVRSLELSADLGLLRARVTRYADSGIEGHELPRAPRATAALGVNWQGPGGLEVGANARYSTRYYSDITNVERGSVPAGWIARARVSMPVGQARVFAYVDNLFNSQRPLLISADPGATTSDADVANMPRPRTLGAGVEMWF